MFQPEIAWLAQAHADGGDEGRHRLLLGLGRDVVNAKALALAIIAICV